MTEPAQDPLPSEEVKATITDVLSRREFQEERSMLEEFLTWLQERLDLGQGSHVLGELLFWVLIGTLLGLTLYYGARFLASGRARRRQQREAGGRHGPSVAQRVAELRREAAAALAREELQLALRKSLFALILGLGGRGDLEYRDAWTNRELLGRGRPAPGMKDMLASVITELEAKEFGREPVLRGDVERLQRLCERYLGALDGVAA